MMHQQEVRTVMVWNKPQEVTADQLSKTVWRASGVYNGERLVVKGRSANIAIAAWIEAVRYKGG